MNHESRIMNGEGKGNGFKLPSALLAHHAYIIEGGVEAREKLFEILENSWKIATKGNPDFSHQIFISLAVDEARLIKDRAQGKAFSAGKKIFVIEADSITVEAQNSLLKILEEPTPNTHFFLIGGCVKNLIPTLNSRVQRIRTNAKNTPATDNLAYEFLQASIPKRLALIKKLTDEIKDEKRTKADALTLLHEIEMLLYNETSSEQKPSHKVLADLEICREYMTDRSAGIKMLLEYVALIIPQSA